MTSNEPDTSVRSPADSTTPGGVGATALMVAAARAAETERTDRLFADPYAADFAASGGFDRFPGDSANTPGSGIQAAAGTFTDYAAIRTHFLDDYMRRATRTLRQVVIVAAGLDTRAFRLELPPEVTVYELDSDEVLTFKQRVLDEHGAEPTSRRVPVATDLREEWAPALKEAGFDPKFPSAWLVEGLLPYLSPEDNERLLARITAQATVGSRLSMEYMHADTVDLMVQALNDPSSEELKSLWHSGGVAEESGPWLKRHGWDSEAFDFFERARSYDRPLAEPGDGPMDRFADAARFGLVTGHRS